ncbi:MAG: prepilin-type N-terminal cleavage/methylation domain-containing protein [Planctomycetales bacterium]|nr:prepilin-type N-terminal cleavage/methylation domain-containing protein [Planctomycetales bacterium]
MLRRTATIQSPISSRRAFTLIELLVVVLIILLLAVITASAVNLVVDGDKVRAAGRQVQSYLEGSRDRAIYAKKARGVRFLLDPDNPRFVKSMIYIEQPKPWTLGLLQVERLDIGAGFNPDGVADSSDAIVVSEPDDLSVAYVSTGPKTGWKALYDRGLLVDGTLIHINGITYRVEMSGQYDLLQYAGQNVASTPYASRPYPPKLVLTTPYKDSPPVAFGSSNDVRAFATSLRYEMELPPVPLPGESPSKLPEATVIHLDRCSTAPDVATSRGNKLPNAWKSALSTDPTGFAYRGQLDILFSPRGVADGASASAGVIHLYVCDMKDALLDQADWAVPQASVPEYGAVVRAGDNYERGEKFAATIFTRTGAVSTHPIHSIVGDPFRYAETGEVAAR